ncbi:transposase [Psychrosphaera sp. B3R10]|uniref:transposase n=1 Tax=unclassified Psychrosphaera TaxID=2641570 RepID=UPI001C0A62E7|nr:MULTISPECIES: transposase [unclassified Psychrosphaera]MBU2880790.1 transposase [Psychrosphaera sp. I2R16]MBU2990991.1 transposase [Psychrosphaera sp. B3R10]
MARMPRLNLANVPQHVVQRGNNRQVTFVTRNDYVAYLEKLRLYAEEYKVQVHAFVLMTNHVHLLLTPTTEKGISQLMQSLGSYYVRYFNQVYNRTGTLWEGRYKSTLVDSENYFLLVSRYIELNPVRANIVSHPADYPWSSYQQNAVGKQIQMLTEHLTYLALGSNSEQRQERYRFLFNSEIPEKSLAEIRDSTDKAWVLGNDKFKEQVEQLTGRRASPMPKGGDRKSQKFRDKQGGEFQRL